MRLMRPIILALFAVSLSACEDTGLRNIRSTTDGPDDFLVNPNKPLQQPVSYAELPPPTPGQSNLVDPTPLADGIAALGGRLGDPNGGIPASEGAIVQYASRLGVSPNIRATVASEDADFRKRKGRFTQIRISKVDRYKQAYKRHALDPHEVAREYRRSGIATPTAPPK